MVYKFLTVTFIWSILSESDINLLVDHIYIRNQTQSVWMAFNKQQGVLLCYFIFIFFSFSFAYFSMVAVFIVKTINNKSYIIFIIGHKIIFFNYSNHVLFNFSTCPTIIIKKYLILFSIVQRILCTETK